MAAMSHKMRLMTSNESMEWYTPPWIIELARQVLGGIDLDPASNETAQQWIQAKTYYTGETLLHAPWAGRIWLNPPFNDTPGWVARLEREYVAGHVTAAVLLVNSAPGYEWFERLWERWPVCMFRDRVSFILPNGTTPGTAKKGQAVFYFGADVDRFATVFRPYGRILLPQQEAA